MGNKNCPSFWRNAVKARLSLRSAIWYSDMEAAPFGKINWVNPILPDRTDRSRSLFNLQLSAGHHPETPTFLIQILALTSSRAFLAKTKGLPRRSLKGQHQQAKGSLGVRWESSAERLNGQPKS